MARRVHRPATRSQCGGAAHEGLRRRRGDRSPRRRVSGVRAAAAARVEVKNAKFCQILSSDQGADIDFDGLGAAEAKYAAKLTRKLAKTGVPAKLKSDLEKLAKVYDRIAEGESPAAVLADEQKAITKSFVGFTTYVSANCAPSTPSGS